MLTLAAACALRRPAAIPVATPQDARIARAVQARLDAEPSIGGGAIRAEVRAATVLLYGSVHGIGAWQCAITDAGLVPGVRSVVDYLVLERGPRDVHCLAPAPAASHDTTGT